MQRLISLLLCLAPLAVKALEPTTFARSNAVAVIASDPSKVALSFNSLALKCEQVTANDQTLEQMVIPDEGSYYIEGQPILPAVSRFVVVPPDKSVELVVNEGKSRLVQAKLPLVLCDEKAPDEANAAPLRDGSNGLIPPVTADMSEPMVIRGVRLVRVTTYPVQYDPQTETYIVRDHIEAELRFGDGAVVNPATHPVRRNRSRTFLKFIQGLAINGDIVGRDDPDYDVAPPYVGHYLVVVHASVLQYAVPFIEWRRKSGYKVDVLPVPAGQAGNSGWIKDQIQDVYDAYLEQGIDPFDLLMLIGDHDAYAGNIPAAQSVLATPSYGWQYACLEGGNNDFKADVGLAQWIAGGESQMTLNTGRTLGYEMTPLFDNTAWFGRGAVFSQKWGGNWNVSLHTNVRWAREVLLRHNISDVRFHENMNDGGDGDVSNFMIQQVEAGVNLLFGRAQATSVYGSWPNVRPSGIFPIYVNYAGHQEAITWMMMRGWDGRHLVGPVAGTDIYGAPQTYSNSLLWLETINGLIQQDLPFGWARVNAVMAPDLYIPHFAADQYNMANTASYGDPGLQPWLGVPKVVHTEFPAEISSTTRRVDVRVIGAENNEPFEGAQVTLYFPGNMPAANQAEYATYNDMIMKTQKSDADGLARFVFEDGTEFVNGTPMYITVTGRDVKPSLDTCTIGNPTGAIELSLYELSQLEGNGDDYPNPGERFALRITAKNIGEADALQGVTATLSSDSPYLIVGGEQISLGNIEPGQESEGDHPVELRFSPDCPDGVSRPAMRPRVLIDFTSGEQSWSSALYLVPHAPHFKVRQIVSGNVIPDTASHLEIEVTNVGSAPSGWVNATVVSLGMGISVLGGPSSYAPLDPEESGRLQNGPFVINGNKVVVPGTITPMQLILRDDVGFVDTAAFTLQVMRPRARAPQGPDAYGYICYDDSDTGWDAAPDYVWAEIDPRDQNADLEGERLDFDGQSPLDIGEALVVQLPFNTKFYGEEYEEITVATNGFIAPGDQREITNFQNWPLDRCIGGGAGMIAPFWDNLALGQTGAVYYGYDQENGRVIIEWSRVYVRYSQEEITFEVILPDPAHWVSETGDPSILFQYKNIINERGAGQEWVTETPYASVGISSPDGSTGLNYSFNNVYPVTSAPLQNRRAILFTTSPLRLAGYLYGRVTDAATARGVPQVLVRTRHGYVAYTDDEGYWSISKAPSDILFDITAGKLGCNDSTHTGLEVAENDTLEINFNLLHPEFNLSDLRLGADLYRDSTIQIPFVLSNDGNGPLTWSAEKRLPGNAGTDPWTLRAEFAAGDSVDDDRIEGVVFIDNNFYLSGANGADSSMIYVLDRAGNLERQFEQPCHTRYGMRDLEWDGSLIWGGGDTTIYGMTREGELVQTMATNLNPCNDIAYDSDRNLLWISGTTTNIFAMDFAGNIVDTLKRHGLRIYGLSYWPEDPDGYNLYITTVPGGDNISIIYKMDAETGDTMRVKEIALPAEICGLGGGFVTNQFDVYSWVYLAVPNLPPAIGGDQVYIYQLDARKDWMELDSYHGRLQTSELHDFTLTLDTDGLPDTLFEGMMHFTHNAERGNTELNVSLRVLGPVPPIPPDPAILVTPANGDTITAAPQYGDTLHIPPVVFVWRPAHNPNGADSLFRYIFNLKVGEDSISTTLHDTTLSLNLDALGLPFTFDRPVEWWVDATLGADTIECPTHFQFYIAPNAIDRLPNQPVVFGISGVYPSPFNSTTTIRFGSDRSVKTTLSAYDILGRRMAVLYEGTPKAGYQKVAWNANAFASGVYVIRLESAGRVSARKIALIR